MRYDFLIDSYDTERLKVVSVWCEFRDDDLAVRPKPDDPRGRSVREHMVHQCVSEDAWFRRMLDIDVGAPPLPERETRLEFIRRYVEDSGRRLERLRQTSDGWWEDRRLHAADLLETSGGIVRHHPGKLAEIIRRFAFESQE